MTSRPRKRKRHVPTTSRAAALDPVIRQQNVVLSNVAESMNNVAGALNNIAAGIHHMTTILERILENQNG